ncbi:MAG: hypothetical protein ACRDK8_08385 [Solirubrobacteraceae bacterium]
MNARVRSGRVGLAGACVALAVSACGGSSGDATGAGAVHGRFPVAVSARFAPVQRLARHTALVITVRNTGRRALPDVAVTICEHSCAPSARMNRGTAAQPFGYDIAAAANTADPSRPLWIVDRGPGACHFQCNAAGGGAGGGVTASTNTWALGRLAPGRSVRFRWALTPVMAGRHVVAWQVDGNLTGTARAVGPGGRLPGGTLAASVLGGVPRLKVTASGKVVTVPAKAPSH